MSAAKRGLGRGLDALLPTRGSSAPETPAAPASSDYAMLPIEKVVPQKGQPRQHFDPQRLQELAQSIEEHGLLEPIVVRRLGSSGRYEIIAGERRWKAVQRAGHREVPAIIRDVDTKETFELALIENVQREDLNAIELAEALHRLLEEHGHTQESLAESIGKDRSTIANALRLLNLPDEVRDRIVTGELSEGHGRALLGAPDAKTMKALAQKVLRGKLSVRQTEALVREARPSGGKSGGKAPKGKTPAVRDLEHRLARRLGTKVQVRDRSGKGQLVVDYSSLDDLDRILEMIL